MGSGYAPRTADVVSGPRTQRPASRSSSSSSSSFSSP
uniref:Uncharacterized protein n=1 Tax=Human herpesvirus 2 TaxID=10310 RepID=A0A481TGQ5_HHV2|nr:hypothetical protein [Human alphaherpesvirus 2]QBH77246.1 hypothetical protein [Human alphaherpesvirus 2]QBH77259.1 hypothetical protein [Human alphaherpesvirus 2]QBH77843.1 hypothetical protein [Human alphaherpesvirus 2]QBH79346.1 hypothetical protein [Human alphaherpesvirus 2]